MGFNVKRFVGLSQKLQNTQLNKTPRPKNDDPNKAAYKKVTDINQRRSGKPLPLRVKNTTPANGGATKFKGARPHKGRPKASKVSFKRYR